MRQFTDMSLETMIDELHLLTKTYRTPVALPADVPDLVNYLFATMRDIEYLLLEVHSPLHEQIPYRLAFLAYKVCLIEQAGLPRSIAFGLFEYLLQRLGIQVRFALALALHRYSRLCELQSYTGITDVEAESFIVHVDERELVPLLKRLLSEQSRD